MKSRLPKLQNQFQEYEDPYPAKIGTLIIDVNTGENAWKRFEQYAS